MHYLFLVIALYTKKSERKELHAVIDFQLGIFLSTASTFFFPKEKARELNAAQMFDCAKSIVCRIV